MNHRIGRTVFALVVGIVVAVSAYRWATNPEPRAARAEEERVVELSRSLLVTVLETNGSEGGLEIVDPLTPNRKVGKVYVYSEDPGWAVSGFYRRSADDRWHPYLLTMTDSLELVRLKVQDEAFAATGKRHPKLVVTD